MKNLIDRELSMIIMDQEKNEKILNQVKKEASHGAVRKRINPYVKTGLAACLCIML